MHVFGEDSFIVASRNDLPKLSNDTAFEQWRTPVATARRRTDLVCERGENLVKIRFLEVLEWVPRKDHPDDGIDLNVEIPAEGERPSERFLVQVKTASVIKPLRNNKWSASIDESAAQKYRRSRHAVFLLRVNLQSEEIRWIDLLQVMRQEPDRRTFSLPEKQRLDGDSAEEFRNAVWRAIQEQNDRHHPPRHGLAYRAQKLEARDPRFAVRGEIIGGVERYTFSARGGFRARVRVVPRTKRDARRLVEAHEFGSKAEINLKSFRVEGAPVLEQADPGDTVMRIEPYARKLRLGITPVLGAGAEERAYIELDAELSRGSRGWELRSADPGCPLEIVLKLEATDNRSNPLEVNLLYERWNGRPIAALPILKQLLALAKCFDNRGEVLFESIEFGERQPLMTSTVQASRTRRFRDTISYLVFLSNLSDVCRMIGSAASYSSDVIIQPDNFKGVAGAYQLLHGQSVSLDNFSATLQPTDVGRRALAEAPTGSVQLQMSLRILFGETQIGELPVKMNMNEFSTSENADGTLTIQSTTQTEMSLDTGRFRVPESTI